MWEKKKQDSCESKYESPNIRNAKKGKKGLKRVYNAFFYSLDGLKSAWCEEEAFRQIVVLSAILIPLGAYLGNGFVEKVLLILPCVLAIIVELINSAIENAIDFAGLTRFSFWRVRLWRLCGFIIYFKGLCYENFFSDFNGDFFCWVREKSDFWIHF